MDDALTYGPKLRCLSDKDDYMSLGNYDTSKGRILTVAFEKCSAERSSVPCRSDDEINDWMGHKFILIITNEKEFTSHKFGDESVREFSKIRWYPLSIKSRTDFVL